jgi:plastocyanin
LPFSKDAVALILHLASRVYLFLPCRKPREALQEDTVFDFAAPASVSEEAETATLSVPRVISAFVLCVMTVVFFVYGPTASSQQTPAPAVSAATATFFTPGIPAPSWPTDPSSPPSEGSISGKVTFEGTPAKYKSIDMSPEPNCAKFYATPPMPEGVVTGTNNSLQNVVVYVSAGAPDETASAPVVTLRQRGCRYTPHVVAIRVNQEIWVQNDDSVTHTVHPMARTNKEWNRSQPPGTAPFAIKYDKPEFIRVRCELHPWMRGIFAVLKNSHFAVTDDSGSFTLPALPPGKYTVTAWHETYGEMSKEVVIAAGETSNLSFVFKAKAY